MPTRQQHFKALVRRLEEINRHPEWEDSSGMYERVKNELAHYVWQFADKITVASDTPKPKRGDA